jgi:hypothetical protein
MEAKAMKQFNNNKKQFHIKSISREDIINAFEDDYNLQQIKEIVFKITDNEMVEIATSMAEEYIDHSFRDDLRAIFQEKFLNDGE